MSLQLWLTLNGNIKNKGLSKSTITIPNTEKTTYDSDNWCYNFAAADSSSDIGGGFIVKDPPKFSTSINHTIAFWYKGNKTGIIYTAPKRTTNGDTVDKMTYSFQNNKLTTSVGAFNNTNAIPENVFTHIVVVFNYTEKKANLYINGVFIETKTFTTNILPENIADDYACIGNFNNNYGTGLSLNELSKGSTYILNGSIKDFRLYDHCLSKKEIKEVYKSLILHYPFNNNGLEYNNPNLAINTNFKNNTNNWRSNSDYTSISVLHDNSFFINQKFIRCNILNVPTSTTTAFGMYNTTSNLRSIMQNEEKYTISAYIRSNRLMKLRFKNELMNTDNIAIIDTQWKLIKYTSIVDTSQTHSANVFYLATAFIGNSNIVAGDYFDVCMFKLEKGENATPWVPNEIDFNNTSIINDTSGFGTYGIIGGNLSYDSNSKVYNSSIISNGNSYIELSKSLPVFVSDANSIKYSLSVWIYPTKNKSYVVFVDRSTDLAFGVGESGSIIWSATNNRNYKCSNSFLNVNSWNHIVIVKDTTDSLYINNTKITNFSSDKDFWAAGNISSIMSRYLSGYDYFYEGKMSDLRIYATALTADDINELYNNRASVDKDGNIFMRNIIEV